MTMSVIAHCQANWHTLRTRVEPQYAACLAEIAAEADLSGTSTMLSWDTTSSLYEQGDSTVWISINIPPPSPAIKPVYDSPRCIAGFI